MNKLIKLAGIAIFSMALAADAVAAETGSCQSKAESLSIGKSVSGKLVDEYDPDYGETTGYAVYYYKVTVKRGDSATIVMNDAYATFDVYEDGEYGDDVSSPPWWDSASDPYNPNETRLILRAADWDEDAPKSVTYYVLVEGDDIGDSFSLTTMYGEVEPTVPQGIDEDTAVSVTPSTTVASKVGNMTAAYGPGYYFKAKLTAGMKYYFGSYDTTTNKTDIYISSQDDDTVVPLMVSTWVLW